jgi:hypothetical protein
VLERERRASGHSTHPKVVKLGDVRFLLNLLLFLAVLGVLMYWFRGYAPQIRRSYQRLQNTIRLFRQARDTMRDVRAGRFNPRGFDPGNFNPRPSSDAGRQGKVVDVTATQFKVVCPTCGDSLTEAQTIALRQRTVRCPGSSRVGQECPYYGRSLN